MQDLLKDLYVHGLHPDVEVQKTRDEGRQEGEGVSRVLKADHGGDLSDVGGGILALVRRKRKKMLYVNDSFFPHRERGWGRSEGRPYPVPIDECAEEDVNEADEGLGCDHALPEIPWVTHLAKEGHKQQRAAI